MAYPSIVDRAKTVSKGTAATMVGGFVLSNPLIATFALGVGVAIWLTFRSRGR